MGWTPVQVGQASLWEFLAAWDGFAAFHGLKQKDGAVPMSTQRARDLGIEGY